MRAHALTDPNGEVIVQRFDITGEPLHDRNRYVLRLSPGRLPRASWSLTMVEQAEGFLAASLLRRYRLTSAMDPQFKRDADGGITLLIQRASPGTDLERNWLPSAAGPFCVVMRLHWPRSKPGHEPWVLPPIRKIV